MQERYRIELADPTTFTWVLNLQYTKTFLALFALFFCQHLSILGHFLTTKTHIFLKCRVIKCNVKTQRKVVSLFREFLEGSPVLTGLSSKCHNFFSIWSLLSLEKYVRQKYSLCLFSKKKHLSLSVSHHFTLVFQKLSPFCPKLRILAGNRQTTKKNFK